MNRIAQEAKRRQGVVQYTQKHGKSAAARRYGVSLSSVKRWVKRYKRTKEFCTNAFLPALPGITAR